MFLFFFFCVCCVVSFLFSSHDGFMARHTYVEKEKGGVGRVSSLPSALLSQVPGVVWRWRGPGRRWPGLRNIDAY